MSGCCGFERAERCVGENRDSCHPLCRFIQNFGDEIARHAGEQGNVLAAASFMRESFNAFDFVSETLVTDAALKRDGVAQFFAANAAVSPQPAGELHLGIGCADEVEDPSASELKCLLA